MSDSNIKTKGKSSPKGGRRACLCDDNTYHIDCCNGDLIAQGIGTLQGQRIEVITQIEDVRIINVNRG